MPPILGQPRARESSGRRTRGSEDSQTIVTLAIQFPGTEPGAQSSALGSLKQSLEGRSKRSGRAYSSVGLERTPDKREVGGSNPPRPTSSDELLDGAVAQLVERQLCKLDVVGSIPISSTKASKPGPRVPARRAVSHGGAERALSDNRIRRVRKHRPAWSLRGSWPFPRAWTSTSTKDARARAREA